MNNVGAFTSLMTLILLLSVGGSIVRSGQIATSAWLGARSVYYLAGLMISIYFLNFMTATGSSSGRHYNGLRWNNFLPLIFCLFALFHSLFVSRTRPLPVQINPFDEGEDVIFKDDQTR